MSFPYEGVSPVPSLPDGRRPVVSSGFGMRESGMHSGLDIMYKRQAGEPASGPNGSAGFYMPNGIPALAPMDSLVTASRETFTGDGESRGWGVTLQSLENPTWGIFINHIVKGTSRVSKGSQVAAGDVLGDIGGSPGSPGPGRGPGSNALKHVHMSLLKNGVMVDGEDYFSRWTVVPLDSVRSGGAVVLFGALALGLTAAWLAS